MERFICKLSSNDPFEKKGYLEVGLWNSKMFRYTLWCKMFIDHLSTLRKQMIKGKLGAMLKGKARCSYKVKTLK